MTSTTSQSLGCAKCHLKTSSLHLGTIHRSDREEWFICAECERVDIITRVREEVARRLDKAREDYRNAWGLDPDVDARSEFGLDHLRAIQELVK